MQHHLLLENVTTSQINSASGQKDVFSESTFSGSGLKLESDFKINCVSLQYLCLYFYFMTSSFKAGNVVRGPSAGQQPEL